MTECCQKFWVIAQKSVRCQYPAQKVLKNILQPLDNGNIQPLDIPYVQPCRGHPYVQGNCRGTVRATVGTLYFPMYRAQKWEIPSPEITNLNQPRNYQCRGDREQFPCRGDREPCRGDSFQLKMIYQFPALNHCQSVQGGQGAPMSRGDREHQCPAQIHGSTQPRQGAEIPSPDNGNIQPR